MCDGCERPSAIWGVDAAGVTVARRVSDLLARTSPHAHVALRDLDQGYYNVLAYAPQSLPEGLGIGLTVFIGSDPEALSARRIALASRTRPQELAVSMFLGPRESPPCAGPAVAAADHEHAASIVAALAEVMVLGPTQSEPGVRFADAMDSAFPHVASGFVAQASLAELFSTGHPLRWGVGRARGREAARRAGQQALGAPNWRMPATRGLETQHGVIVARAGVDLEPDTLRFRLAAYLPRSLRWRVAVFRAEGLEPDEVEVVALGSEGGEEPRRPFGV